MPRDVRRLLALFLVALVSATTGHAQTPDAGTDGPPAPTLPNSVNREGTRATVLAVRLNEPLRVDGRLDESLYTSVTPMSDFTQVEPQSGAPATERTEVWVSFDAVNLYVTVRAWESQPERMIVNEMRRDSDAITQNENFAFILDTFGDKRNGVMFNITPIGGRRDGQVTNEGNYNGDWNPIWDLAVGTFDGGWVAEAAVPFRSLRYAAGPEQIWGFNARRINRWKNEVSFLSPVPAGSGSNGLTRVSNAATLVGLQTPRLRSLDIKPFVISDITTDNTATPRVRNDLNGDFGLDVKYGVTAGLTADLTYRTDFAQVEADEQQVNLTRFSLFFPEKREFFLENQGLFTFGGAAGRGNVPFAFYSRRIGLDQGREVPIQGGGRLSGRVGKFGIGLLSVQADSSTPGATSTNFSVARVKRDILRKSSIGALVTRRSVSTVAPGSNELYGLDGQFGFFQNMTINAFWAQTETTNLQGKDTSYRVQFQNDGDRYGLTLHQLLVGKNFNPETGFIFRNDIFKRFTRMYFSPRPRSSRVVRKVTFQGQIDYIENASSRRLETRQTQGSVTVDFQNSDNLEVIYDDFFEGLAVPFEIAKGVTIPTGGYNYGNLRTAFQLGQQRPVSGTVFVEQGSFWGGNKTSYGFSSGRVKISPQFAVEPGLSVNRVTLPYGDFTATLVSSRLTYTMTPQMFVSGLVQYNSSNSAVSANVRLRWEYQPGSELFVVFNESRDTDRVGFPGLQNRSLIVKLNRLFRP